MWDAVIVGSGAGGAPLALSLSRGGLEVLLLEKGPRYGRADYAHDELLKATQRDFFVPAVTEEPHVVVDHDADGARPELSTLGWIACCVGGGTAHMGGTFYRFHPDDFRLRSRLGAYEEISDWPYGYNDLEAYYTRAEWEIGVSGSSGSNPFEGPRSRPYPMPPLDSHALAAYFDDVCRRLGLHAFPTPRAINSRLFDGRPACAHCDFCAGFGCPTGARGSTQEALIPRAERTGRCQVRAGATVREVTVGPDGRAKGCIYIDAAGVEHEVRATIVCVCCSAVESARLLLRSISPQFPNGLANGCGLVGRHLQFHVGSVGRARFRYAGHPDKPLRDRNPFLGRSVMDYYFLPEGVADLPKGGVFRFDMSGRHPIATAERVARDEDGRWLWGHRLAATLRECLRESREVEFEVFQDFLPNERTFVELDPDVKDRWGLPVARIHLHQPAHHVRAARWLVGRGLAILEATGADEVTTGGVGYVNDFMVHGTCRAGTDPRASVLNEFCQAHEVPNLFVVDGSFMPTSGGASSTLTIVANSLRTADYILDRARAGDLQ